VKEQRYGSATFGQQIRNINAKWALRGHQDARPMVTKRNIYDEI
jgi:hypothetical protein